MLLNLPVWSTPGFVCAWWRRVSPIAEQRANNKQRQSAYRQILLRRLPCSHSFICFVLKLLLKGWCTSLPGFLRSREQLCVFRKLTVGFTWHACWLNHCSMVIPASGECRVSENIQHKHHVCSQSRGPNRAASKCVILALYRSVRTVLCKSVELASFIWFLLPCFCPFSGTAGSLSLVISGERYGTLWTGRVQH